MGKNYNPKLEDSLIAKILQNPEGFSIAEDMVEPFSFVHPPNKILWRTFEALHDREIEINAFTVSNHLDTLGQLDILYSQADTSLRGGELIRHLSGYNDEYVRSTSVEGLALQLQNVSAQRSISEFLSTAEAKIEAGEDPTHVLSYLEQESGKVSLSTGAKTSSISTSGAVAKEIMEEYIKAKKGGTKYIKTGLWVFDHLVGGLYPGRLLLILGTSGSGKSLIMHNILYNTSIKGIYNKKTEKREIIKAGLITLEQQSGEIGKRFIQMISGINSLDIEEGSLSDKDIPEFQKALKKLKESNILFDDSPSLTLPQLRAKMRKMAFDGARYIVVDQMDEIKLLGRDKSYKDSDTKTFALKEYGREFNVHVMLAHQFRKSAGNASRKGVTDVGMEDANEGGEKGADIIFTPRHDESGNYGIFLKLRQAGRGEKNKPYRLDFDLQRTLYSNYTGNFNHEMIPEEMESKNNFGEF